MRCNHIAASTIRLAHKLNSLQQLALTPCVGCLHTPTVRTTRVGHMVNSMHTPATRPTHDQGVMQHSASIRTPPKGSYKPWLECEEPAILLHKNRLFRIYPCSPF